MLATPGGQADLDVEASAVQVIQCIAMRCMHLWHVGPQSIVHNIVLHIDAQQNIEVHVCCYQHLRTQQQKMMPC